MKVGVSINALAFLSTLCLVTTFAMWSVYDRMAHAADGLSNPWSNKPGAGHRGIQSSFASFQAIDRLLENPLDKIARENGGILPVDDDFQDRAGEVEASGSQASNKINVKGNRLRPKYASHPRFVSDLHDGLRRGSRGNPGGVAFVTMVNSAWMEMLEHMLYTAITFGNITSMLVVALDEAGLAACLYNLSIPMPCYDGSAYVGKLSERKEKLWNSEEYVRITWSRPKLVADILNFDIPLVNVDTDVVFLRPINPLVETECSKSSLFSCSCELGYCNMGFYLIKPHTRTRRFWNSYLEFEDDYFNDQEVYQRIEHVLPDVGKCCLDAKAYGNSCIDPHSDISGTDAIVWHAICMTGLQVKKQYFMNKRAWFLPADNTRRSELISAAVKQLTAVP